MRKGVLIVKVGVKSEDVGASFGVKSKELTAERASSG